MNKDFLEELEKAEKDNETLSSVKRLNVIADILRKKVSESKSEQTNIMLITTFYNYVNKNYDKFYSDQYKNAFSTNVCKFYTKDKINEDIEKIVEDKPLMETIIDLGTETLIKNLVMSVYEKSKENDKYLSSYEFIKNKCQSMGILSKTFFDIELDMDKSTEIHSDAGKALLNIIEDANNFEINKPIKSNLPEDSLLKDHSARVNDAMKKINDMSSERKAESTTSEPATTEQNSAESFESNFDTKMFDELKVTSNEDYNNQKEALAAEELNLQLKKRKLEQAENKRIQGVFGDKAKDLGVTTDELRKVAEKQGIDTKEIDKISFSPTMSNDIAANEMVVSLPNSRFNNFIQNLFNKNKLKHTDMYVEEINNERVLKIDNDKVSFDRIASCEKIVLNMMMKATERKAKCKKFFIDTKNNVKKTIKNVMNSIKKNYEKVKDAASDRMEVLKDRIEDMNYNIRDNISNGLTNIADKISPEYYNPYDVTGRVELSNSDSETVQVNEEELNEIIGKIDDRRSSEEEKEIDDILKETHENNEFFSEKGMDVESMLELLKKKKVQGLSGTPVGEVPSIEETDKGMKI